MNITKENDTTGIVLLNLGGPDSLESVRPFLYNLFSDRDIIRLGPSFLQKPLAWLISALRSGKTRDMYHQIGGRSPILEITKAQAAALEESLNDDAERAYGRTALQSTFRVYIGMRYWHPFMKETVRKIVEDGVKELIVLSLYPHYSKATTGSSLSDFRQAVEGFELKIRYINEWYDYPPYIDSIAELVAARISDFAGADFDMLFSAHSLPRSFIDEGDPYLQHIKKTIEHVTARLSAEPYHIKGLRTHLSFQSKTGPVQWLEPSTDETIIDLANRGCRNLLVVPISFVSDHIETLYEIDILYKNMAHRHGINLKRCASLNTSDKFINAMKGLIIEKSRG